VRGAMKWAGPATLILIGLFLMCPFMSHYSSVATEFCIAPSPGEVLEYAWVTAPHWMILSMFVGFVMIGTGFALLQKEDEEREVP